MIDFIALFPVYVVDNLDVLKDFYEKHFGFQAVFFESDFYLHLLNPNNGVQIGFLMPELSNQPEFLHAKAVNDGMVMTFEVKDAQVAYDIASNNGLDINFELVTEEWGQKHFMLRDPSGLMVDIVENLNN